MKLYYVETPVGCGIRAGKSINKVRKDEIESVGTFNGVYLVREATREDIEWVRAMGGYIPSLQV